MAKKTARTHGAAARQTIETSGSEAAYEAFLPEAMKLAASEIVPMRADPALAVHNVQIGVASVLAERKRLGALPETDVAEVETLDDLALAVVFATTQVARIFGTPGLAGLMARGVELRALLLRSAEALALAGLVPQGAVDSIRVGRGKLDAARDLVALANLFAKNAAAIRGKHAITGAQIREASDVGTELLRILKPGRARRKTNGATVGVDERDRLWTLLVERHDRLWRAGAYLFGRQLVEERVPSLQASRGGRRKKTNGAAATVPAATA